MAVAMANRGPAQHVVVEAAAVVPGRRDPALVLNDVARLLMLYGALAVVVATMGSPPVVDAGQAILGLGLWLLGVCLLAFVPILTTAGRRFPRLALIVAAMADTALSGY